MIRVIYYYSACVGIRTPDCSVLCDPWFTDGIYDGAWFQYPKLVSPLEKIGRYDFVYISHIHPDHYDPEFLRTYLEQYPESRVLIGDYALNHLHRKMTVDGIPHEVASEVAKGDTRMRIFPTYELDSAFAIARGANAVVNMNDNSFDGEQIDSILAWLGQKPSIALLGYTGAGPYPQTYFSDPIVLEEKARAKKKKFFARYCQMRDALEPRVTVPFAGKYLLGGRLSALNRYRGIADAVEVARFDSRAVVLADGGDASIDTETLVPTSRSRVALRPGRGRGVHRRAVVPAARVRAFLRWPGFIRDPVATPASDRVSPRRGPIVLRPRSLRLHRSRRGLVRRQRAPRE